MGSVAVFLLGLFVVMVVTVPAWPYSRRWSHGPSGVLGVVLVVVLVQFLMGTV